MDLTTWVFKFQCKSLILLVFLSRASKVYLFDWVHFFCLKAWIWKSALKVDKLCQTHFGSFALQPLELISLASGDWMPFIIGSLKLTVYHIREKAFFSRAFHIGWSTQRIHLKAFSTIWQRENVWRGNAWAILSIDSKPACRTQKEAYCPRWKPLRIYIISF